MAEFTLNSRPRSRGATTVDNTYELPLFPLHTVLYPGNRLPLRIFEPRYVDLVGRCLDADQGFGVVAIKSGEETGRPALTVDLGTVAKIVDFDHGKDGLLHIVAVGAQRFRLFGTSAQSDNLMLGQVQDFDPVAPLAIDTEFEPLRQLMVQIQDKLATDGLPLPAPRDACELAYGLASYLPLALDDKLAILSENDPHAMLALIATQISHAS